MASQHARKTPLFVSHSLNSTHAPRAVQALNVTFYRLLRLTWVSTHGQIPITIDLRSHEFFWFGRTPMADQHTVVFTDKATITRTHLAHINTPIVGVESTILEFEFCRAPGRTLKMNFKIINVYKLGRHEVLISQLKKLRQLWIYRTNSSLSHYHAASVEPKSLSQILTDDR